MELNAILANFTVAAAAALLTWFLTRRFMHAHYVTLQALQFETGKNELIDKTKTTVLKGEDFQARLEIEYRRGKEDGQATEL